MLHPIDGYSEREARELVGRRVTQIDTSQNAANNDPRKGTIIAHDDTELKPGVKENCVWVQWDGSEKAHQFSKLNEGKDFKVDGLDRSKEKQKSASQSICPSGMPPSRQQIDAYEKLLSSPNMAHEPGMTGTINNSYDPHRDRKILASIRSTEAKLAETQGKAMSSFNGKANEQHLRMGFNRSSGMGM